MPKKKEKESWVAKLKKKVRKHFDKKKKEEEAFRAIVKKAKEGKKARTKKTEKKSSDTKRTKDIKRQLRRNLSPEDIKRLQGKKKNNPHKKSGGY